MTFEDESTVPTPHDRRTPHYHGDEVRTIFFISALVLIIAQSTGADLPLSTLGAVSGAILLVVAAGITNPDQTNIHWINAAIAIIGTLTFGTTAVEHYRKGFSIFDASFIYIEALTLLSLVALYYTTRTIRCNRQRSSLL